MGKTRKFFRKINKKTYKRRKTKGKKNIHKKTIRYRKKTGGLVGAAENVEKEVKEIEKLIIIGPSNYKRAIGLLINLTKPGKISCRKSGHILKKNEICELDKTNSYDKANQLFTFIKSKVEEETINNWIKKFDSSMDNEQLTALLEDKKHRENKLKQQGFDEETLDIVLVKQGKTKLAQSPYETKLMNATIIMNSEWYGLFLNKVFMYELLRENSKHYLEISKENPELGLERITLDAQEQTKADPNPLSSKYTEFTYPFRTWILESGKGGERSVESYKKRNRTIFKEVLEYFKEENPDFEETVNKVIGGLKMDLEKEPMNETQFENEVKELLEWEKTPEKEIYDEKFGKTYNNNAWSKKLEDLRLKIRDDKQNMCADVLEDYKQQMADSHGETLENLKKAEQKIEELKNPPKKSWFSRSKIKTD